MKKPVKRKHKLVQPKERTLCEMAHMANEEASTDVLGSYTGTGAKGDPPEQDADDL
jgi:hypothetical protein